MASTDIQWMKLLVFCINENLYDSVIRIYPLQENILQYVEKSRKSNFINFLRCLKLARKADWTFLNNLATFGGFLFSYFHRFTIGIQTRVIIAGSFTSQVAVTSLHQIQHQNTKNTRYNIVLA